MKTKYLLIWLALQIVFLFTAIYFLVNGRQNIAGPMFEIFIYQSAFFFIVVIYSKRKWFLR